MNAHTLLPEALAAESLEMDSLWLAAGTANWHDGAQLDDMPAEATLAVAADLAHVRRLSRQAMAGSRRATALLHEMMTQAADLLEDADGAPEADALVIGADALAARAQALARVTAQLAEQSDQLRGLAERLQPNDEARLAGLARQLLAHKESHADLVRRAEAMLAGGEAVSMRLVVAAVACPLGQWLSAAQGDAAARHALESAHRSFHNALAGIVFAFPQGRMAEVEASMAALQAAQRRLASVLDGMAAGIPPEPEGTGPRRRRERGLAPFGPAERAARHAAALGRAGRV